MKVLLLVALGGAFGAVSRWGLAGWVDRFFAGESEARFPFGILLANVLGCFAIGLLLGLAHNRSWMTDPARLVFVVGFLGSFTTFSTFGWNTFELIRGGHAALAFANVAVSVVGGLLAVWVGWAIVAR